MDRHVIARFSRARAPKNMPEKNASSTTKSEQQINYEARPQCFPSVQTHHDFTFDYIRRTKSDEADEGGSRRSRDPTTCVLHRGYRCQNVDTSFSVHVLAPDGPLTYCLANLGRLGLARLIDCSSTSGETVRNSKREKNYMYM